MPRASGSSSRSPAPAQIACRYAHLGCKVELKNKESEQSHVSKSCKFSSNTSTSKEKSDRKEVRKESPKDTSSAKPTKVVPMSARRGSGNSGRKATPAKKKKTKKLSKLLEIDMAVGAIAPLTCVVCRLVDGFCRFSS